MHIFSHSLWGHKYILGEQLMGESKDLKILYDSVSQSLKYSKINCIEDAPGTNTCTLDPKTRTVKIDLSAFIPNWGLEHAKARVAHEIAHLEVCPRNFSTLIEIEAGSMVVEEDREAAEELAHIFTDIIVNEHISRLGFDVTIPSLNTSSPDNWHAIPIDNRQYAAFIGNLHFLCAGKPSPFEKIAGVTTISDSKKYYKIATDFSMPIYRRSLQCSEILQKYLPRKKRRFIAAMEALWKVQNMLGIGKKRKENMPVSIVEARKLRLAINGQPAHRKLHDYVTSDSISGADSRSKEEKIGRFISTLDDSDRKRVSWGIGKSENITLDEFDMLRFAALEQLDFHLLTVPTYTGGMVTPLYYTAWNIGEDTEKLDFGQSLIEGAGEIIPNYKTVQLVRRKGHGQNIERVPQTLVLMDTSGSMGKNISCISTFALIEAHHIYNGKIGIIAFTTEIWLDLPPSAHYAEYEHKFYDKYASGGTDFSACIARARDYISTNPQLDVVMVSDMCAPDADVRRALSEGWLSLVHTGEKANAEKLALETRGKVVHVKSHQNLSSALLRLFSRQSW